LVYDFEGQKNNSEWSQFQHTPKHTGYYSTPCIGLDKDFGGYISCQSVTPNCHSGEHCAKAIKGN